MTATLGGRNPVSAARAAGLAAALLAAALVASCGGQGGAIARQFGKAETIAVIDNSRAREIASIRLAEDIRALAAGLAHGEVRDRQPSNPRYTLVLTFPDGSKGKAYVDVDYATGPGAQVRRGWVQYEGIGHVYPSGLFWDVFDNYAYAQAQPSP